MKILVTRTTGPIAEAVVRELLARGHRVRVLSGQADDDAQQWPGVEPFRIADESLALAAAGCDAIVHLLPPLGDDEPPVPGIGDVVAAAEHANVRRLVCLCAINEEREEEHLLVRNARVPWTILRHGPVIGPGDEISSTLLELVRVLPAVPIGDGERPFQPTRIVLGTLEGHPLAGIVEFTTSASAGGVQFAIDVYARAANVFDFIALRTLGRPMQDSNWRGAVRRMIEVSGGKSDGVQKQVEKLDAGAAQRVELWVRALVQERKREQGAVPPHRDAG